MDGYSLDAFENNIRLLFAIINKTYKYHQIAQSAYNQSVQLKDLLVHMWSDCFDTDSFQYWLIRLSNGRWKREDL